MRIDEAIEVARRADEPDTIELANLLIEEQDRDRVGPPPTRVDARVVCDAVRAAARRARASRPRPPRVKADCETLLAMAKASAELEERTRREVVPTYQRPMSRPQPAPRRQPWRDA
jgi:hypothetical protein